MPRKSEDEGREVRYPYGGAEQAVPGGLHYHSRSGPPDPHEYQKSGKIRIGGIFRNNPSLLLILVDIIVVLLVMMFLLPFLRPGASKDNFFGYAFSLHGYIYGDTASVSLIIQNTGKPSRGWKNPETDKEGTFIVNIRVADTDLEETQYFRPGEEKDDTVVLRSKFEMNGKIFDNGIRIKCKIFQGGKTVTLEKKLTE